MSTFTRFSVNLTGSEDLQLRAGVVGRYTWVKHLGDGQYGTVYLATDTEHGDRYATPLSQHHRRNQCPRIAPALLAVAFLVGALLCAVAVLWLFIVSSSSLPALKIKSLDCLTSAPYWRVEGRLLSRKSKWVEYSKQWTVSLETLLRRSNFCRKSSTRTSAR